MTGSASEASSAEAAGVPVRIEPPGETNLVGYFLRSLVGRALERRGGLPASLEGARYLIRSDGMEITLSLASEGVQIRRGRWPRIDATVRAGLPDFLALLKDGGVVRATLGGAVGVRGKVWRLLPLMGFLRSGLTAPAREGAR